MTRIVFLFVLCVYTYRYAILRSTSSTGSSLCTIRSSLLFMTSCKVSHSTFDWSVGETPRCSVPKIHVDHCSIAEIDQYSFGLLYGSGTRSLFGRRCYIVQSQNRVSRNVWSRDLQATCAAAAVHSKSLTFW